MPSQILEKNIPEIEKADSLDETVRGNKGYGSSGVQSIQSDNQDSIQNFKPNSAQNQLSESDNHQSPSQDVV